MAEQQDKPVRVLVEVLIESSGNEEIKSIKATREAKYIDSKTLYGEAEIKLFETFNDSLANPIAMEGIEAEREISKHIDKSLIEFYIFNGEYLNSPGNFKGENINKAIRTMFKVGAIKTAQRWLEEIAGEYQKKLYLMSRKMEYKEILIKKDSAWKA